jgi:hypothetical protein
MDSLLPVSIQAKKPMSPKGAIFAGKRKIPDPTWLLMTKAKTAQKPIFR